MNSRALVLVAVLLAALAAWLLLRGAAAPAPAPSPDDEVASRPDPGTHEVSAPPTFPTAPPRPPPGNPPPRKPVKDITEHGSVLVVPLAPEGGTVPKELRIDLEAVGPSPYAQPLALPVGDDQYRYESVPIGTYRVRVSGDLLLDAVADAVVKSDRETRVEVQLLVGGMATYKARLVGGEEPETVTVTLLDARGNAIPARYFSRKPSQEAGARIDTAATLPSEGVVSNLKPGRYTLRATTASGNSDDQRIEVKAGETVAVEFKLLR